MKTIEEFAAEQVAKQTYGIFEEPVIDAINETIEFAQRWIPVEEELPENNESLIVLPEDDWDAIKTIKILAMTDMGTITDNRRIKMQVGEIEWVWFMNYDCETVTHWRPINLK